MSGNGSAQNTLKNSGSGKRPKISLSRDPNMRPCGGGMGDWMHINSMSLLGPNKWYDNGDERFHPDNIIADGRETNIIFYHLQKEWGNCLESGSLL